MPARLLATSALFLLLLPPRPCRAGADTGLERARKLHSVGSYAAAQSAYGSLLRGKARAEALLGLASLKLEVGEPAAALLAARKVRGKLRGRARLIVGEALLVQGKLAQAAAELKVAAASGTSVRFRAWVLLGRVYREQGKGSEGQAILGRLYDAFDNGKINSGSAEQLTLVAMACRHSDNFRDASDTLADAVRTDPLFLEAYLELGEISLEKYEAGHAERHFGNVLRANPNHPRALVGLARVKLEQSASVTEALELLQRARRVAPGSPAPRIVLAEAMLDAENYGEAEEQLVKALERNPRHLGALSILAVSFLLRDDKGSFQRIQAKILGFNPRYGTFYRRAVGHLVRHHRYAEALELGHRAAKLDPQDWYSLADLGTNYLRLGHDKKGLEYLRRAWKGDRFNVRTFNLLNLFEDVLAKEYTFISSAHFRLRVHKTEAAIIKRTVVPLLEEAYALYVKKYRFTPKGPIIVELFKNPKHYAVRTVGLPGLGALGVCFGRVITSISPVGGRFNWGQVLWHELNHVFTIQISRSRVPRWLTEGLADMEPILRRPEWKREHDFEIYRALSRGKLRSIRDMNTAFTQARNMSEMVVAYYQGSLMARFLVKRWGIPRVLEGLEAFAKGKRLAQVLPAITGGLKLSELDRRFRAAEKKRLAHYRKSFYVDPESYRDLKARQQAVKQRPKDLNARAALALAYLVAGKQQAAQKEVKAGLSGSKTPRILLFTAAQLSLMRNDRIGATNMLKALLKAGGDGYEVRLMLGRLFLEQGDLVRAKRHLDLAKKMDPERVRPYMLMVQGYDKAKREDDLIRELKKLVQLDQQKAAYAMRLVKMLTKRGDHRSVRKFGELAYYINPASARLHLSLARAHNARAPRRNLKKARWHLETALLVNPKLKGVEKLKKKLGVK